MDRRIVFMEKMSSAGWLPLPLGYIHVYDHTDLSTRPFVLSKLCLFVLFLFCFLIQFYVPFKIISAHMRRTNQ